MKIGAGRLAVKTQAPPLGEHTEETLAVVGYSGEKIGKLKELKAI